MSRAFLDTNILIYGFTVADRRRDRAMQLIRAEGRVSVQCLNEFAHVARRKLKMGWDEIARSVAIISEFSGTIVPLTPDLHRLGLRLAERYLLSIYDAMIAAAALKAECDVLYSEDMHDGLVIDGRVRIVNPFAPTAE